MKLKTPLFLFISLLLLSGCGGDKAKQSAEPLDPMQDKGIGPIKSVTLGPLDETLAAEGKVIYEAKCTACHKPHKRFIGPAPVGILDRRTPEWVMNMILNPDVMVQENAQARQLLMEYSAPMANQNLTKEEARAVLEYFRTLEPTVASETP